MGVGAPLHAFPTPSRAARGACPPPSLPPSDSRAREGPSPDLAAVREVRARRPIPNETRFPEGRLSPLVRLLTREPAVPRPLVEHALPRARPA